MSSQLQRSNRRLDKMEDRRFIEETLLSYVQIEVDKKSC